MTIIDKLEQYTSEKPNSSLLFDEAHTKGITYAQLDDLSGRVYAYLKNNGIGREDFVLINLPRGILPIVAMVGVWKAGAAWALVEDTYAPERIEYIRSDCGCKAELSSVNWEEVVSTDYLAGHEATGEHDAAYAIYTSGTTGNPKGVLHEYGNLEMAIESIKVDGVKPFSGKERAALLAPMNFVASVIVTLQLLSVCGARMYVVGYATIKNPMALKSSLSKSAFPSPSLRPRMCVCSAIRRAPSSKCSLSAASPPTISTTRALTLSTSTRPPRAALP